MRLAALDRPNTAWLGVALALAGEEFGLERMRALLERLGDPAAGFAAGPRRRDERQVDRDAHDRGAPRAPTGLRVGAYISPHVRGWYERLDTDARGVRGGASARVRADAEAVGATQFEVLTAAAFADFAARGVEVAAVEAGLGGRLDATNVLDARVVLLTNVGLEHTEVLGDTREEIARGEARGGGAGRDRRAPGRRVARRSLPGERGRRLGGAREAAEAFLGRPIDHDVPRCALPGRLEVRGEREVATAPTRPRRRLAARAPARAGRLHRSSPRSCATRTPGHARARSPRRARRSSRPGRRNAARAARRSDSRARAEPHFDACRDRRRPARRRSGPRARSSAAPFSSTGSLYLLADLHGR